MVKDLVGNEDWPDEGGGRPNPLLAYLCGLIGVGLIVGYVVLLVGLSRSRPAGAGPTLPRLNASVALKETELTVENADADDWTEVELVLNSPVLRGGSLLKGGYRRSVGVIKARSTFVGSLLDFRTEGGLRFEAEKQAPQSILIRATVRGERRFFAASVGRDIPEFGGD